VPIPSIPKIPFIADLEVSYIYTHIHTHIHTHTHTHLTAQNSDQFFSSLSLLLLLFSHTHKNTHTHPPKQAATWQIRAVLLGSDQLINEDPSVVAEHFKSLLQSLGSYEGNVNVAFASIADAGNWSPATGMYMHTHTHTHTHFGSV
jgi:hypothetical protein